VPQELIYLAQAESGFLPRAVSNKSATGMWQFVQFRGREYGLNQTAYSDDRLDPEKATRSAARHLRDLYKEFGDWYLAIAGYNCGPGAIEKAVERTGYADYWELRNRNVIPKETSNYVPIILAMTIMMKNARDYDLEHIDLDPALEYDSTTFASPMNIALIADLAERPVSDLRELNPALLGNVAPSGFEVHIPKGSRDTIMAELQNVPESKRAFPRAAFPWLAPRHRRRPANWFSFPRR
jgi:membrane-bound lytic murein transglycosylase D